MVTEKMLWDAVWLAYGFGLPALVLLVMTYAAVTTPLPERGRRHKAKE